MDLQDFLDHVSSGRLVVAASEEHQFMHHRAQEALRIVTELNGAYRTRQRCVTC